MASMNGPDFALCGPFTGKNGQSAIRWLKKLEWELRKHSSAGSIDPANFLQAVDLLLADDAAVWAETTPLITELLETPAPTSDTVSQFKSLFSQRYPIKISETAPVHFDSEISDLRQQEEEALIAYYKRTAGLLSRVGGRDRPRPTSVVPNPPALSPLETAMLDTVMRAFTRGIHDPDVRRDALRGLVPADRSLLGVYTVAEESRRSKAEYARLQEEVARAQELQFYRDVVHRNMPTVQIDSLRASYHANMPHWGYQNQLHPQQQPIQQLMAWPTQAPAHPAPAPYYPPQPQQQPISTTQNAYQAPHQAVRGGGNYNGGGGNGNGRSNNPYINGTMTFTPGCRIIVCIRCGEDGHISRNCTNPALPRNEQIILRNMILGDRDQFSGFPGPTTTGTGPPTPATTSNALPQGPPAVGVQSITYGLAGLRTVSGNVNSTEVFLGEGSGPNKRPHVEEPPAVPLSSRPPAQPTAFQPGTSTGQDFFFQSVPVQKENERPKKKGQKRTGKAATIAPLVGLIDENTGFVDKPTSVRQLLKSQKIDMTWMDFCVWSPTVCRELKRLLTRMSNRKKKGKSPAEHSQTQQGTVNSIAVDGNTRFLSTFMGADKAFRIPCSVRVEGSSEIALDRSQVQADQGSDMNVISTAMARQLRLQFHSLSDVGFAGLTMKTADHRETLLHHWVYLELGVEGIWRQIRCLVAPELPSPMPGTEHLSLLLGIPWLYSVNATIGIRGSRIEIGDPAAGEAVRDVIGPELVFSQDHNLLMYPKAILTSQVEDDSDDEEPDGESETDSAVSLSEEEEEPKKARPGKKGFH